jgi:hypothetical protein
MLQARYVNTGYRTEKRKDSIYIKRKRLDDQECSKQCCCFPAPRTKTKSSCAFSRDKAVLLLQVSSHGGRVPAGAVAVPGHPRRAGAWRGDG